MIQRLTPRRAASKAALASFLLTLCALVCAPRAAAQDASQRVTPGALGAFGANGAARGLCPLKHTDVRASVAGFLARVTVTQEFENPFKEKIEAVYTFPLPQAAAVDDMTMRVGERTVRGKIMRREEASEVYRAARDAGQVAGLLDQERPNVFTQSVANVMPGERVTVVISYVETLKYEAGTYEFVFPMVVGPRYIPGAATGRRPPRGRLPNTDRVPDASRITPPVVGPGRRAGHDVSVEVSLDAGVPVEGLKSPSHEIDVERPSPARARVRLKSLAAIPNKDFVLRYDVAGRQIRDAVLTHRDSRGGYFTLILQPPDRVTAEDVTPKELVFVLDTSGSMEGFPIEKAKETMRLALDNLYPQDTFNLITFAGDTHVLFEEPVPATRENLLKAKRFLRSRNGDGGTEMMEAIKAALEPSDAQGHVRVVCFMTDGEVGNDFEIISEVQKHPNARVFSFGVGESVNRFLLDKMADHGRGAVEYVSLGDDGSAAARRFHERVRSPLLTDIQLDWGGLQVADVYPRRIPDLFGSGPVVVSGRYTAGGRGVVRLRGTMSGQAFEREIAVELPESKAENDVLATLWARRRVEDLMGEDYEGAQSGEMREDLREAVTGLGLEYRLLTQFTSFVAVEETTVTDGGKPRRIDVPVETPEGTSPQNVIGDGDPNASGAPVTRAESVVTVAGGVGAGGAGSGAAPLAMAGDEPPPPPPPASKPVPVPKTVVSGGLLNGKAVSKPLPAYPPVAKAASAQGTVAVQVVVDESGRVVSAQAVSGHPLLQQAAVAAARQAKFSPTMLSGKPVRVSGVITYNFASGGAAGGATSAGELESVTAVSPEAEEQRWQQFLARLHPLVASVVGRLREGKETPGEAEAKFVREGKAELRIRLTENSPAVLAQLKELGFELILDAPSAGLVVGRMPIEKISALADVQAVRYVAPEESQK
ncbi:MAG TPA: TonB family protein [Pyrinomonadaceae bacterium]|jgi:Ca-activated chloride channel family protein